MEECLSDTEDAIDYSSIDDMLEYRVLHDTIYDRHDLCEPPVIDLCNDEDNDNNLVAVAPVVEPIDEEHPPQNTVINPNKRVQGIKFALTFPQCDYDKILALNHIMLKFGANLKWAVVSQEPHKDGNMHLHVAIHLKERIRYTDRGATYWDFVARQHGNYQLMRSAHKWVKYCIKGGNVVSTPGFDPAAFVRNAQRHKSQQGAVIANKILKGEKDLMALSIEHPGYMINNLAKVEQFCQFVEDDKLAKVDKCDINLISSEQLASYEVQVLLWLKVRSRQSSTYRDFKHLRIEGPTMIGKSSLIFALRSYFRVYLAGYSEKYFCDYDDDKYDLIVLDEFKSQWTLQFLNAFSDGFGIPLKRKGRGSTRHSRKVPILLLSNYTWDESYFNVATNNHSVLDTTMRRFATIKLDMDGNENFFILINRLELNAASLMAPDEEI